jgi:hypothetical protein
MANREPDTDRLIRSFAGAETLAMIPPVVDVLAAAPPNPPESVQAQFVGASYTQAYSEAASFVRVADKWMRRHTGRGFASAAGVIDFGSGWGRISRFLLAHVAPTSLYSIDVDVQMTALVGSTLPGVNAMTVPPMPPTALRAGVADSMVAFSVFSHLSPESHLAWAGEFGRLLSDRGMVVLTLLDEVFFDQVAGAKALVAQGSVEPWAVALGSCFQDLDQARAGFARGEAAYAGVGGGGVLTGDFYGWAAVPRAFIERVWGEAGFEIVEWVPSGQLFAQAMVGLAKRPKDGRRVRRLRRTLRR